MKISDLDFELPEELIAKFPSLEREDARLLVLKRHNNEIIHTGFSEIVNYLESGDMLILNNTKVMPVRLCGKKPGGGRMEFILVRRLNGDIWEVMRRGSYTGRVQVSPELTVEFMDKKRARLIFSGILEDILSEAGMMPLPPYIKRKPIREDHEWYQTVYAEVPGSIAAPTAGLHFTRRLLNEIISKGVLIRKITLHVGPGTFRLIRTDNLDEHKMEEEFFEIPVDLFDEISMVKKRGKKVVAVGTTTTRALEGYASGRVISLNVNGTIRGYTDIFIYPGYRFNVIDGLVTNFHLPRSTPLLLVSAFSDIMAVKRAYMEAIERRYRFFSYGDAMLII